ncbi:MAG: hypothetical protein PHC97_01600 [Patescibacteria group bacterium]|nr:hypothetical protein [Patescibacteria group bacterium]
MATIPITKVTNEFPDWVKEALIGLEFPVVEVPNDQPLRAHNFWGPPINSPLLSELSESVHCVDGGVFLQILHEKNTKAADWLGTKTLMGLAHWVGITGDKLFLVD